MVLCRAVGRSSSALLQAQHQRYGMNLEEVTRVHPRPHSASSSLNVTRILEQDRVHVWCVHGTWQIAEPEDCFSCADDQGASLDRATVHAWAPGGSPTEAPGWRESQAASGASLSPLHDLCDPEPRVGCNERKGSVKPGRKPLLSGLGFLVLKDQHSYSEGERPWVKCQPLGRQLRSSALKS